MGFIFDVVIWLLHAVGEDVWDSPGDGDVGWGLEGWMVGDRGIWEGRRGLSFRHGRIGLGDNVGKGAAVCGKRLMHDCVLGAQRCMMLARDQRIQELGDGSAVDGRRRWTGRVISVAGSDSQMILIPSLALGVAVSVAQQLELHGDNVGALMDQ